MNGAHVVNRPAVTDSYWIGLIDQEFDSYWKWITGEVFLTTAGAVYYNWDTGQPYAATGMASMTPQCAAMKASATKWEGTACTGTRPAFVCESGA